MQIFYKKYAGLIGSFSKRGSFNKGFTLIELLVVIAIIGILASIVLVSLGSARTRAKDARITADMNQIRTIGEMMYSGDLNYVNMGRNVASSTEINTLGLDIENQGGTNFNVYQADGAYCAEVQFGGTPTKWGCVNSGLYADFATSTNPTGCNAAGFNCAY